MYIRAGPQSDPLKTKVTTLAITRAGTRSSHHHYVSINQEGCWGTTDDFTSGFLHFSLFSTSLWDLANSRPVHSLMSSHLFLCLPCLLSPFNVPCKMVLARLMNGRHDHSIAVGVSLRWSGSLCVVRLPVGS